MMSNPFELQKIRDLVFASEPLGQADRAFDLLDGLQSFKVEKTDDPARLRIHYSLLDYTLEGLELALSNEGFILDNSLSMMMARKLVYYCEEVQYHNLDTPEHPVKSHGREIFVKVYDHHAHGDHDDTPRELREFK